MSNAMSVYIMGRQMVYDVAIEACHDCNLLAGSETILLSQISLPEGYVANHSHLQSNMGGKE